MDVGRDHRALVDVVCLPYDQDAWLSVGTVANFQVTDPSVIAEVRLRPLGTR